MAVSVELLNDECIFKTSRSSGKGGQNVNKVASKVEVLFNVAQSRMLTDAEKILIAERLSAKIDVNGNLHAVSQTDRSQWVNRRLAVERLSQMLVRALEVQKPRKPTKIPRRAVLKRLENKSAVAGKKETRRKPNLD